MSGILRIVTRAINKAGHDCNAPKEKEGKVTKRTKKKVWVPKHTASEPEIPVPAEQSEEEVRTAPRKTTSKVSEPAPCRA